MNVPNKTLQRIYHHPHTKKAAKRVIAAFKRSFLSLYADFLIDIKAMMRNSGMRISPCAFVSDASPMKRPQIMLDLYVCVQPQMNTRDNVNRRAMRMSLFTTAAQYEDVGMSAVKDAAKRAFFSECRIMFASLYDANIQKQPKITPHIRRICQIALRFSFKALPIENGIDISK